MNPKTIQIRKEKIDKSKIDYVKAETSIKKIFQKLKLDLEARFSDLQTANPFLDFENYPPRISLSFFPKADGFCLQHTVEKELKAKQSDISQAVKKIADKYDLVAVPYHIGGLPIGRGKYLTKKAFGLGIYTFYPKYGNFKK